MDTTGSGEFDLYLTDTDGNGIADDVCFYSDGSDEPDLTFGGQEVEAELEDATIKFKKILRKKNANVKKKKKKCLHRPHLFYIKPFPTGTYNDIDYQYKSF